MQLHEAQNELDEQDIKVRIVTFDSDFMAKSYVEKSNLAFPLLLDEDSEVYDAYGIEKAGWWALYNPIAIIKYLILIFSGTTPGKPGKDWHQLGGDVLIDPNGIVRMHYRSQNPHDRPSIESILECVRDHS